MITKIIILYILNVFLNRWLNKKLQIPAEPEMWFLSLLCTVACICMLSYKIKFKPF